MIFLDNASTTPLAESAANALVHYSTTQFFNPSANYAAGFGNFKAINETKQLLAQKLGVRFQNNIIFTGSATEATNLAIFGSYRKSWKKAIFSAGEHPSVYNSALQLQDLGIEVIFVDLAKDGAVDIQKLEKVLDEEVNFVSIMQVSNETGAINDVQQISKLIKTKAPKAIFHVDGVQAFGKIPTNLLDFDPDFYTISAHKFHGPKGLGALFAKKPEKLRPIIFGGGQEYNLRSGTENVPAIMALKAALEDLGDVEINKNHVEYLKKTFFETLQTFLDKEIRLKVLQPKNHSPYIINLSFVGIKGQVLQNLCDQNGLLISTGSACSSKKMGNRILENIGYSKSEILGNIRISFSKNTSVQHAQEGAKILATGANQLWRSTR